MTMKPAAIIPLAIFLGAQGSQALAQEAAKTEEKRSEKIQVTGSRIKRIDVEGASPVSVIDRETIDNSGVTSVRELLSNFSGTSSAFDGGGSSVAGGVSAISLKGLGEGRTLVLIDGVRMPKHPELEGFDLNSLPLAAIERVEVLNQAAAAIYGSDAIGGVINIITRKQFEGTMVELQVSQPTRPGGGSGSLNGVIGLNSGNLQSTLVINIHKEDMLIAKDRDFSKDRVSGFGYPGVYGGSTGPTPDDVGYWPAEGCPNYAEDANGVPVQDTSCLFNYNTYNALLPSIERVSGLYNFTYPMNNFDITGKVIATHQVTRSQLRPENNAGGQATVIDQSVIDAMPQARFDQLFPGFGGAKPASGGVEMLLRLNDFGNSTTEKTADLLGAQVGIGGATDGGWEWKLSLNTASSKTDSTSSNKLRTSVFNEIITTGEYIPWDPERDLEGIRARLVTDSSYSEETMASGLEASATTTLGQLGGGDIGFAVAAGFLAETYKVSFDDESSQLDALINVAGAGGKGDRTVSFAAVETNLPFARALEVGLAARYDQYSDFGAAFSPQMQLLSTPSDFLKLRGSVGTAFKAPSLDQLNGATGVSFNSVVDYPYCEANGISREDCEADPVTTAGQVKNLRRGNPDLDPEKSFVYGLGFVVQPIDDLSVSADYWKIISRDLIDRRDLQDLVDEADPLVVRDPNDNNKILHIDYPLQNLSTIIRSGVDVNLNYTLRTGDVTTQFRSLGTWYLEDKNEPKNKPMEDQLGQNGSYKWKMMNEVDSNFARDYGATLTASTIGTHQKFTNRGDRLPQYTRYDAQVRYAITDNSRLALGVINLLDKQGGIDDTNFGDVDSSIYHIKGREYYLRLGMTF
ncbi:TonB-dependent receptor plug domain-containing protein [Oligoflexus tunisiensis]|uniref:TonB-dependent receptor plug domain-containing protein n=1 Tax=Oligoflexus tunisiensis TaxID=708132 RepID=UPI000AE3A767|nr:TonB-dependent receptor [Oligoflexus tunisiensis]